MIGVAALGSQQPIAAAQCSSNAISFPKLEGAKFQTVSANVVTNFSQYVPRGAYFSNDERNIENVDFCNVSLAYTHTGHHDTINVQVWLPMDSWNGRMMGVGGGGWNAGLFDFSYATMAGAVSDGYSAVSTDGGHTTEQSEPENWAWSKPGKVDLHVLEDFASVCLGDAAVIGKSVTENFYGSLPKYSYWNGCSTGGRQGLMLSQRYPKAYDGIMAAAPATHWPQFLVAELYPQLIMNQLKQYPHACEMRALTEAAISSCDGYDGVIDGVVSNVGACKFNPDRLVGHRIKCQEIRKRVKISSAAAVVAKALWGGAKFTNGSSLWYGLSPDAAATGPFNLANTECSDKGNCHGVPFSISEKWLKFFVAKDPHFDFSKVSHGEYEDLYLRSMADYMSLIGSNDPDLNKFKTAGGKMIMWHGLADQVIFPGGSEKYYNAVMDLDSNTPEYFRYFEAPGVGHCLGGNGAFPIHAFDSLVQWVEKGEAPTTLAAVSPPDSKGRPFSRPLCLYPQVARHNGMGDPHLSNSFACAETYLSSTPTRILWQWFKEGIIIAYKHYKDLQAASPLSPKQRRKMGRIM